MADQGGLYRTVTWPEASQRVPQLIYRRLITLAFRGVQSSSRRAAGMPTTDLQYHLERYQIGQRVSCALLGLVAYEYVTTLDREVACVWQRKFTATSLLLLLTRWTMVVYQALQMVPLVSSTCERYNTVGQLVFFASLAEIALFSGLRVYALWHDSRFRHLLCVMVLLLGCIPIGTNIFGWSRMRARYEGPPFSTCAYSIQVSIELNTIMLYLTRGGVIASDLLVLILTWTKTFTHWRQQRSVGIRSSISTLLLRDGTLYFLVLLASNMSQMLTYSTHNVTTAANVANSFLQGMPPVLVQRFMLNLRQYAEDQNGEKSNRTLPSSICFNWGHSSILGNIGEPLDLGEAEPRNEE